MQLKISNTLIGKMVLRISYPNYLKADWYERTAEYRIHNNDDDESTVNEVTVVK